MATLSDYLRQFGRETLGTLDTAATIGKNAVWQPVSGIAGLAQLLRTGDLSKAVDTIEQSQALAGPQTEEGARNLGKIGKGIEYVTAPLTRAVDTVGEASPLAGAALMGLGSVVDPTKGVGRAARAGARGAKLVERSSKVLAPLKEMGEGDIVKSMMTNEKYKRAGGIPAADVDTAIANRLDLRAEEPALPKKAADMTEADWAAFGKQHGVDMSVTPSKSLGISDLNTKREIMVPGGLEGKFTIPDLFQIKANNFDPSALPQDVHNALMQKFLRTYERPGGPDAVDKFNALNFSLLSPNAPLTPNEFLAQRLRIRTPEELDALANRAGTPGLAEAIDAESGVGAASRGGMGVKGTANLGNQAELARLIRDNPQVFEAQPGESLRDVGFRVMNQVPGLSVKTASLGVPFFDLPHSNTSAVDLWMIRKHYQRLLEENPRFRERMDELRAANPDLPEEKAAINIISDHPEAVYRYANTGELHPDLPSYLMPDKLAFEPKKFTRPSEFYSDIMRYVDESRATHKADPAAATGWGQHAGGDLPLFPEQWRLWDTYRGRVEPHEMAHPDWRKLPQQSWEEMQGALQAHKEAGYMAPGQARFDDLGNEIPTKLSGANVPWPKLYYGQASPEALGITAGLGIGTAAAAQNEDVQAQLQKLSGYLRGGAQ